MGEHAVSVLDMIVDVPPILELSPDQVELHVVQSIHASAYSVPLQANRGSRMPCDPSINRPSMRHWLLIPGGNDCEASDMRALLRARARRVQRAVETLTVFPVLL